MLGQTPVDHANWMQYGAFGVIGLLVTVGIPWLLNWFSKSMQAINDEHTKRVEALIDDHSTERNTQNANSERERQVHVATIERVCCTFKEEMKEERQQCERRVAQLMGRKAIDV